MSERAHGREAYDKVMTRADLEKWLDGVREGDPHNDRDKIIAEFERLTTAIAAPKDVAKHINSLSPIERERFVDSLRANTIFCWQCFNDDGGRACHCTNDE